MVIKLNDKTKICWVGDKVIFYNPDVFPDEQDLLTSIRCGWKPVNNPNLIILTVAQYATLFFDENMSYNNTVDKILSLKELLNDLSEEQRECK